MKRFAALLTCCLVFLVQSLAWGQVVLIHTHEDHYIRLPRPVPRPPQTEISYRVKEVEIQGRIVDQAARVQVSQTFHNNGSRQIEAQFVFPIPYDAVIDSLTLLVDGKELPGKLLPAAEAQAQYEAIVRSSKDPALLKWIGSGMFQTNVFPIPPGAERKVTLTYNQLLRRERNLTDFLFPLSTANYTSQPVEKVAVTLSIESSTAIKSVYSPTHGIELKRPDDKHAVVSYTRTNDIPSADFRLIYDVQPGKFGASVISYKPTDEDGYFLLLASPEISHEQERIAKTVVFVLDKSGSMTGKKIEQAKSALKFVLNNLHEGDLFNIVAYDSGVESFRPELERYNDEQRKAAIGYVENLYAGGGTNIHGATTTALSMLKDDKRPSYVIFLTDGLPTVGEQNESKLVAAAKDANKVHARMLNFGVGYDVNSRLLDRLSRENFGASEYVRPDEDIEAHVSAVYSRISSPVLTNVELKFEFDQVKTEEGEAVNRVYPKKVFDVFAGEQLVVVGRYKKSGAAKVVLKGQVGMEPKSFDFPASFAEKSANATFGFVEKLWAMRRIGEIIDEIDLHGKNDELVKELVALSTKHAILTPYTSFLADETVRPGQLTLSSNVRRAEDSLKKLEMAEGREGLAQRAAKSGLQNAGSGGFGGRGTGSRPAAGPEADRYAAPSISGPSSYRDEKSDRTVVVENVRESGQQALYRRGRIVMTPKTADLDVAKDKAKIQEVARYSDDYFALVKANTVQENELLSSQMDEEELLVELRGQVYWIK
jgi:Ca-activated chloride channel family protein